MDKEMNQFKMSDSFRKKLIALAGIERKAFDNFVVGDSNAEAYQAAHNISCFTQDSINILYLYGPLGVGKNHLLNAIRQQIGKEHSEKTIYMKVAETMASEIIWCLVNKEDSEKLKEKYTHADVFLLGDVHYLAGMSETVKDFITDVVKQLILAKKKVVLTGDCPLEELKNKNICSCEELNHCRQILISVPDKQTRLAILKQECETRDFVCEESVLETIVEKSTGNVRNLLSTLRRYEIETLKLVPENCTK